MAASATVTYPSGVVTPRAQVHPVTIVLAGLTANTTYAALYVRPGASRSELTFTTDGGGNATLIDNPQLVGSHTLRVATSLGTYMPGGPTTGSVEGQPAATVTATYSVGV